MTRPTTGGSGDAPGTAARPQPEPCPARGESEARLESDRGASGHRTRGGARPILVPSGPVFSLLGAGGGLGRGAGCGALWAGLAAPVAGLGEAPGRRPQVSTPDTQTEDARSAPTVENALRPVLVKPVREEHGKREASTGRRAFLLLVVIGPGVWKSSSVESPVVMKLKLKPRGSKKATYAITRAGCRGPPPKDRLDLVAVSDPQTSPPTLAGAGGRGRRR